MGKNSIRSAKKLRAKEGRRVINLKALIELENNHGSMLKAKHELKLAGYYRSNEEGPDKWMRESVMELLAVLTSQGHSGYSIGIVLSLFDKLARHRNLTDLTLADDEFVDCGWDNVVMYQNLRDSRIFKDDVGITFNDAFVKNVFRSKRVENNDFVNLNSNGWSGTLLESIDDVATGRGFRTCYFKQKDIDKKRLPIGQTIGIPCTEIEVKPDDFLMFVDVNEPKYKELQEVYDIHYFEVPNLKGKQIISLTENYGH